jgi:uncharacterized protein (TIGR00255 family)
MTGHGQATGSLANVTIDVETRAVNNRFLKIVPKVSNHLASFEHSVESIVRESIRRGSVQISVSLTGLVGSGVYRLNQSVLENYWKQAYEVAARIGAPSPAIEVFLQLPGVIAEPQTDDENPELIELAAQTLRESITMMNRMRAQEGEAMAVELRAGLERIEAGSKVVAERAPVVVAEYQNRLETRMKQALDGLDIQVDASVILREAQIFADRSDIREELVRLASHLTLFRKAMDDRESQGRKLDFLVQEINREINTIGSKANDATITEQVVLMKTSLEQIRELVQNVE